EVVMKKLKKLGGTGGIIAIDNKGNPAMIFNTPGMYRGHIDKNGTITIKFYND
ncbi:MAG: beta-aspartyl-peptidase, partial [bacterium]|nr:beta-aspartyl-peptidase [bacterium]